MSRVRLGSHYEVAHVWAQQSQPKGNCGNMLFEGQKIYSYGKHFCMARILPNGVVVYGTHSYSSSTGKHQSIVRGAVSHRRMVYCYDPDRSASRNRESAQSEVVRLLADAKSKPRIREVTRGRLRGEAVHVVEKFNEYLEALPKDESKGVKPIVLENMGELVADAERAAATQRARVVAAEKRRAEEQSAKIIEWRSHVFNGYLGDIPTMLRLSTDKTEVQTSRGASIPVSHAKRLWPLIENCRKVGMPLKGRDVRLGHYTLTEIKANGDIVVGCHNIPFAEIEGIAHELGLTDTSEAQRALEGKTKN